VHGEDQRPPYETAVRLTAVGLAHVAEIEGRLILAQGPRGRGRPDLGRRARRGPGSASPLDLLDARQFLNVVYAWLCEQADDREKLDAELSAPVDGGVDLWTLILAAGDD